MYNINNKSKPTKNLAAPNPKFVLCTFMRFRAKITEITGKNYRLSLLIMCSLQDLLKLENEVDDLMLSGILFHSIIPV